MKSALAALLVLTGWTCAAKADSTQQRMAAEQEAAGFNEHGNRRRQVAVSNCTVTTFAQGDWGALEKVLWSSFRFELRDLRLLDVQKNGRRFLRIPEFRDGYGAAVMPFEMAGGTQARHEMAMRRSPKPPHSPSPRAGADSDVYKDKRSFFILHEGQPDPDKADRFISLLSRYRLAFRWPLS